MIEDFIEKDIIRKVKLVEFIFELNQLNVTAVAKRLGVTFNTIKSDCQKLSIILEEEIAFYKMTSSHILIYFKPHVHCYDLIKKIYYDSNFLKICSRYITGEYDYLTIADEEFLSVTKAFKIKKNVENYFKESLHPISDRTKKTYEFQYRSLILSIWTRCDYLNFKVNSEIMKQSEIYADKILNILSNRLNKTQYTFFKLAIYLCLLRNKNTPISIPSNIMDVIEGGLIFNIFKDIFTNDDLEKNELAYLTIIYRTLPYNPPNYFMVDLDYRYVRNRLITKFKQIDLLINLFEKEFDVSLHGDILFESPLFNLLYVCTLNIGNFLIATHTFLSNQQLELLHRIEYVFKKWNQKIDNPVEHIPYVHLQFFCQLTSFILTNEDKSKIGIVIVAENESSHIAFRKSLEKRLSLREAIMDNTLYYSLNDVPSYIMNSNHLIICERTLFYKESLTNKKIYPISLCSLSSDINHIASFIMNIDYSQKQNTHRK